VIEGVWGVTSKKATFDVPPPGAGFTTVTDAVLALAMSDERMLAVSCELLTKVVERAVPFHFTLEVETKPVPFTVSVNPAPPGAVASGTRGWLIKGMGFVLPIVATVPVTDLLKPVKPIIRPNEQRMEPVMMHGLMNAVLVVDFVFMMLCLFPV